MRSGGQAIAELKAVCPAAALLGDNFFYVLFAGEQKGCDWGWDVSCDFCNPVFADDAGSAGHLRNQAQRRCATFDCQCSFFYSADAADFDSRDVGGTHEAPLFAVRDPDVFDLGSVLQEPA